MATLQQQISDKFLEKLAASKDVDAGKREQVKDLLADMKSLDTADLNREINAVVP